MKTSQIKTVLLAAIFLFTGIACHAYEPDDVEKTVKEIVQKYDGTTGVECMTITKGEGLGLVKMMLRKQFGKQFMKDVTSITIIDYSQASEETCESLRNDMDLFTSILEEFKLNDKKEFSENKFIKCFAASSSPGILTHFIVALEDDKTRTIMHMSGKITADQFK